jgi:hypothetical protein
MVPSVAESNSIVFFLWGHLKEYICAGPLRTTEDIVARLEAVITAVDARILGSS